MAMPAPPRRLTYADYAALPDDGKHYQLIDGRLDMTRKRALYAEHNIKEYWIVWQEVERIEVYLLGEGGGYGKPSTFEAGETLTTPLLPGFSLPVSDLYRDLPEA